MDSDSDGLFNPDEHYGDWDPVLGQPYTRDLDGIFNPNHYKSDPKKWDTDSDGHSDGWEVEGWTVNVDLNGDGDTFDTGENYQGQCNPLNPIQDIDEDNLLDQEEKNLGTDAEKGDTDADMINDGNEAKMPVSTIFIHRTPGILYQNNPEIGIHNGDYLYERETWIINLEVYGKIDEVKLHYAFRHNAVEQVDVIVSNDANDDSIMVYDGSEYGLSGQGYPEFSINLDSYFDIDRFGELHTWTITFKDNVDDNNIGAIKDCRIEVIGYSNPLSSDTDGDSIIDGQEIIKGTDEFITCSINPDSDMDGVNDNEDGIPAVVANRFAFLYSPAEYEDESLDEGTGDWANELAAVLRVLGFQITTLVDDNVFDGHIISANDYTTCLSSFTNLVSQWNDNHPNQKAIVIIYYNSHGGADGEEYHFCHGDCDWSEQSLENSLDTIGQSLDFIWLATCHSWEFRDHVTSIDNVGNVIFWGANGVSQHGGQDANNFYDAIIDGKSIEAAFYDVSDLDNLLLQQDNYLPNSLDLNDPSLIGS